MEWLIRLRPILVGGFFGTLVLIGVGAYLDSMLLFRIAGVGAHMALFLFTTTEAFGRVARERSKPARVMARVLFSMYAFMVVGWLVSVAVPM